MTTQEPPPVVVDPGSTYTVSKNAMDVDSVTQRRPNVVIDPDYADTAAKKISHDTMDVDSVTQKRPNDTIDPDYADSVSLEAKRQRTIELDAKHAVSRKIQQIVSTEFEQEITNKERELHIIDQRLNEAKVMMDRLRACIVANYYGMAKASTSSQLTSLNAPPPSVHPAVKKLIGKRPAHSVILDVMEQKETTQVSQELIKEEVSTPASQTPVNSVIESSTSISSSPSLSRCSSPWQAQVPTKGDTSFEDRRSRTKVKKKVIVGNVSKYIPVDERESNDMSSHKWMVYVRGPKSSPDISHFVRRVWFFLHHSYKPNDLVEVSSPPFHLTRRGWGEFPVRVQLHFVDPRNKNIDIIHHLKLDKTLTGLQTLGSETVVEVEMDKNSFEAQGSKDNQINRGPSRSCSPSTSVQLANHPSSTAHAATHSAPSHTQPDTPTHTPVQSTVPTNTGTSGDCESTNSPLKGKASKHSDIVEPPVGGQNEEEYHMTICHTVKKEPEEVDIDVCDVGNVGSSPNYTVALKNLLCQNKNVIHVSQPIKVEPTCSQQYGVMSSSTSTFASVTNPTIAVCTASQSVSLVSPSHFVVSDSLINKTCKAFNIVPSCITNTVPSPMSHPPIQVKTEVLSPEEEHIPLSLSQSVANSMTVKIPQEVSVTSSQASTKQLLTVLDISAFQKKANVKVTPSVSASSLSSSQSSSSLVTSDFPLQRTSSPALPQTLLLPQEVSSSSVPPKLSAKTVPLIVNSRPVVSQPQRILVPSSSGVVNVPLNSLTSKMIAVPADAESGKKIVYIPSQSLAVKKALQSGLQGTTVQTQPEPVKAGTSRQVSLLTGRVVKPAAAALTSTEPSEPAPRAVIVAPPSTHMPQAKTSLLTPRTGKNTILKTIPGGKQVMYLPKPDGHTSVSTPQLYPVSLHQNFSVQPQMSYIIPQPKAQTKSGSISCFNYSADPSSNSNIIYVSPKNSSELSSGAGLITQDSYQRSGAMTSPVNVSAIGAAEAPQNFQKMSAVGITKHGKGYRASSSALGINTNLKTDKERQTGQFEILKAWKSNPEMFNRAMMKKKLLKSMGALDGDADSVPLLKLTDFPELRSLTRAAVKLHPLVQAGVNKFTHPYCAESVDQWNSWPIGKQRASEWHRCCFTLKYLKRCLGGQDHYKGEGLMTKRQLVVWCQHHGFTPFVSHVPMTVKEEPFHSDDEFQHQDPEEEKKELPIPASLTKVTIVEEELWRDPRLTTGHSEDDSVVDIVTALPTTRDAKKTCEIKASSEPEVGEFLTPSEGGWFVHDFLRQRGLKLEPVELEMGLMTLTPAEMLYQIAMEFCADVIRDAAGASVTRGNQNLSVTDVYQALTTLPSASFFKASCLGKDTDPEGLR